MLLLLEIQFNRTQTPPPEKINISKSLFNFVLRISTLPVCPQDCQSCGSRIWKLTEHVLRGKRHTMTTVSQGDRAEHRVSDPRGWDKVHSRMTRLTRRSLLCGWNTQIACGILNFVYTISCSALHSVPSKWFMQFELQMGLWLLYGDVC